MSFRTGIIRCTVTLVAVWCVGGAFALLTHPAAKRNEVRYRHLLDAEKAQGIRKAAEPLYKKFRFADYESQLRASLELSRDENSLNALAWFLCTCPHDGYRDGNEALLLALDACERSRYKDHGIVDTLAAAYAEIGDFEQAVYYQKTALQIARSQDWRYSRQYRSRLDLYEKNQPFRQYEGRMWHQVVFFLASRGPIR